MTANLVSLAFICVVLLAAWHDKRFLRIPNIYPVMLMTLFLLAHIVLGFSPALWSNLMHFSIALAVGMLLFQLKWVGGGDAKLYAAIALWFGLSHGFLLLFLVSLSGGLIAAWLLATRRIKLSKLDRETRLNRRIPYGIAIAMGTLATLAILGSEALFLK